MPRVLLFFAVFFPAFCFAQADTSRIKFKDIFALRCPRPKQIDSMVASLNKNWGIKMDTICIRKVYTLLDKYRADDFRQRKKFMNQANSYAAGWREKVPGRCNAGGPPPICPVDHWYRAGLEAAMAEYHYVHNQVLTRRLNEVWAALDKCITERPIKIKLAKDDYVPPPRKDEPGELRIKAQN